MKSKVHSKNLFSCISLERHSENLYLTCENWKGVSETNDPPFPNTAKWKKKKHFVKKGPLKIWLSHLAKMGASKEPFKIPQAEPIALYGTYKDVTFFLHQNLSVKFLIMYQYTTSTIQFGFYAIGKNTQKEKSLKGGVALR